MILGIIYARMEERNCHAYDFDMNIYLFAFESRIDSKIDGKDRDGISVNQVQSGKSFAKLLIERCEEVKECLQRPK